MSNLIDVGGRVYVAPENVAVVAWQPLRTPYADPATGQKWWAAVVIETYHNSHFVPCPTAIEARDLAARVRAEVDAVRALRASGRHAARPAKDVEPAKTCEAA